MQKNKTLLKSEWNKSYVNKNNFLFYPDDEVIRFMSKYIRKRIGLNKFLNLNFQKNMKRSLDLGCGIGRHVIYCHEMGLDSYGIDLSDIAIKFAHDWAKVIGLLAPNKKIKQGDVRYLPWDSGFFNFVISHGVLDSMSLEIAKETSIEIARVMDTGGLFYCDLISGDDSDHAREYYGEEIVKTEHEKGTIQSYFNFHKIQYLFEGLFTIKECQLIKRENVLTGTLSSRYHLILEKI